MKITKVLLPLAFALCTTGSFANDQKMAESLQSTASSQTAKTAYALGQDGNTAILIEQLKEMKLINAALTVHMKQMINLLKEQKEMTSVGNVYLKRISDATQQ